MIGFTLRRLAAKLANSFGISHTADLLRPRQLGAGVAGGCEAAIHATRRFLEDASEDEILVKLDFRNTFNTLHRKNMLVVVANHAPEILPFATSAYSSPTVLRFGDHYLESCEGPQQGDPLGPLLFCLAIQPMLSSLTSELTIGYLDDLTLAGDQKVVAEDVQNILAYSKDLGLTLNVSKCEVIAPHTTRVSDLFLSSFQRVDPSGCLLPRSSSLSGRGCG